MKRPTSEISRTPGKISGILLDTHFPGARIKKGPEMADQPCKIRTNSEE